MNIDKLKIACKKLEDSFRWYLNESLSDSLKKISEGEGLEVNTDFWEHVYRAYHCSYKVSLMKSYVYDFIGLLLYLYLDEIPITIFKTPEHSNKTGFWSIVDLVFPKKLSLEKVILKGTLTYKWLKEVLEMKPRMKGAWWQDWTEHYLKLFGITYWYWACAVAFVGSRLAIETGNLEQKGFISYSEGIYNYVLYNVNEKGLKRLNTSLKRKRK